MIGELNLINPREVDKSEEIILVNRRSTIKAEHTENRVSTHRPKEHAMVQSWSTRRVNCNKNLLFLLQQEKFIIYFSSVKRWDPSSSDSHGRLHDYL